MTLGGNLTTRVVLILVGGFIALQLFVIAVTSLPTRGDARRPYNLPLPGEAAALVNAVEQVPPGERQKLVDALGNGLYSVSLTEGVRPSRNPTTEDLVLLGRYYAAALPGHAVAVDARGALLGSLIGSRPRPARFFAPVTVTISLNDGRALQLVSQPSPPVRLYMRQRSVIGALAGLTLLAVLALAVRQTTRPLVRLARGIDRFEQDLDAPDLPAQGPAEVRALAEALNDMKGRVRTLMAARTRMLAAIAHDMRTYLTRMRLRAEFVEDADQRARMIRDLDEMALLLDDTLLLASADAPHAEPAPLIDLRDPLRAAVEARGADPATVRLILPDMPVHAHARPLSLRRIADNLADNALRYGSRVEIRLAADPGGAVLTFSDDGPGIPADEIARLGEPFHRGEPSRNRESGGAGLGLAIVQALAARDQATVHFGTGPMGGLAVTVRYPPAGKTG